MLFFWLKVRFFVHLDFSSLSYALSFSFLPSPAFPLSSYNVSESTLAVMREEWVRGDAICSEMLSCPSSSAKGGNAAAGDNEQQPSPSSSSSSAAPACWARLLEPDCFFLRYKNYLVVEIWARDEAGFLVWEGWVHSRLRQLVLRVERQLSVRPWPKALFPPREGEEGKKETAAGGATANGECFSFWGAERERGKKIGTAAKQRPEEKKKGSNSSTFFFFSLRRPLPNTGNGEAAPAAAAAAASTEPWRCFYFFGLKKRPLPAQAPGLPPSRAALAAAQPVNLNAPVADFRQQVLNYERWRKGMDLSVRHVKAAALPACALVAARRTQAATEASRARFSAPKAVVVGGRGSAAAPAAAAGATSGVKRDREEEQEGGGGGASASASASAVSAAAAAAAVAAAAASDESPAKRAREEGKGAAPAAAATVADAAATAAAAASGDLMAAEAEAGMAAAGDIGEWAGIDAGKG